MRINFQILRVKWLIKVKKKLNKYYYLPLLFCYSQDMLGCLEYNTVPPLQFISNRCNYKVRCSCCVHNYSFTVFTWTSQLITTVYFHAYILINKTDRQTFRERWTDRQTDSSIEMDKQIHVGKYTVRLAGDWTHSLID